MADVNETVVENTTETNTEVETTVETTSSVDSEIVNLKAQIQNLTETNAKLKRANDKLASENGDLNKKYRQKLTEDEQKALDLELERQKQLESMNEKDELIKSLQRKEQIAKATSEYLALGWTNDEATKMANADADNNTEERMKILKEVAERQKKETDVANLKGRPPVNTGSPNGSGSLTKADFNKMSYAEKVELYNKDKALYDELVGN